MEQEQPKLLARGEGGVEIWLTSKPEFVVTGTPFGDDARHNCDQMGCGWQHVLWRSEVALDPLEGAGFNWKGGRWP